jgi:hypothetical protein
VEAGEYCIHLIPPDILGYELIETVLLPLPHHFSPWDRVVAAEKEDSLCAPVGKG